VHFSPPLGRAFAHFASILMHFLAHFTDGNSFVKTFKKVFKSAKMHKCAFLHFYLGASLVNFLFFDQKVHTFSKGSRSLCSAPF